jgi:hypothetical protein
MEKNLNSKIDMLSAEIASGNAKMREAMEGNFRTIEQNQEKYYNKNMVRIRKMKQSLIAREI